MLPTISLGPLSVPVAPLIWLAAIWIGLSLAEKWSLQAHIEPVFLDNLVLVSCLAGILGARLVYVLQTPSAFSNNPLSVFLPSPLMLDPGGGLLFAGLSAWVLISRKHMPIWSVLDAITPLLVVLSVAAGLANLASGEGYGLPTQSSWGVNLWGENRHPTQIYEIILALLTGIIILQGRRVWAKVPGSTFVYLLVFTCVARIFSETFRGDAGLIFGTFRLWQLIALIGLAFGLWTLGKMRATEEMVKEELDGHDPD